MAKRKKKTDAPKQAPGVLRKLTIQSVMSGSDLVARDGDGLLFRLYGVAGKSFVKNTGYGSVTGLTGQFEARRHDGVVFTSRRAFPPAETAALVVALLGRGCKGVRFGVEVHGTQANGGMTYNAIAFADVANSDPLDELRELAQKS